VGDRLGAAAAVLAGGRGLRMGGADKQSLLLGGEILGRRALRLLGQAFDELIVVTSRPDLYAGTGAACVADIVPGRGPASGIHAALSASRLEWVYVMGCDMPAFSAAWAGRLVREAAGARASGENAPLAVYALFGNHMEPLHALYSKRLAPAFEHAFAAMREPSIKSILEGLPRVEIPEAEARAYSPDWGLFANINTPEDLARAREREAESLRPGILP
jgi:molybdopterin-guanine dinucleotide biosynthesis protein A